MNIIPSQCEKGITIKVSGKDILICIAHLGYSLAYMVDGSDLSFCTAEGPSSNFGSAPHGSSTPPTEPHLEDIEHFVSMTCLFYAKCIEKNISYFSLLSCF
jgi:hypothetical protein